MDCSELVQGLRLESIADRLSGGSDSSGLNRVLAGYSLGITVLSAGGSIIAYRMLPAQMRIHWTLGMGPYYGPEFAPTPLILTLFPMLIAGAAVLGYLGNILLCTVPESSVIRPYHSVAVLGTLTILLILQLVLTFVNLF